MASKKTPPAKMAFLPHFEVRLELVFLVIRNILNVPQAFSNGLIIAGS